MLARVNFAFKRPFASVRAQVVKEVVPFSKHHSAVLVVTFHDSYPPGRLVVLVPIHPEAASLWHESVENFQFREINVLP